MTELCVHHDDNRKPCQRTPDVEIHVEVPGETWVPPKKVCKNHAVKITRGVLFSRRRTTVRIEPLRGR